MREFKCNCPQCQTTLLLKVQQQTQLQITCPKCQLVFQVNVPSAAPTPTAEYDPFASELPLPAAPPGYSPGMGQAEQGFYSAPTVRTKKKRKKTGNNLGLWIAAGLATSFCLLVVGGLAIYLLSGNVRLPSGTFGSNLLNFDSVEKISKDYLALRGEIEQLGRTIPSGDQSQASAQLLLDQMPKYDPLLERIYRLPSKLVSLDEYAEAREKQRAEMEELRQRYQGQLSNNSGADSKQPLEPFFWRISTGAGPDEHVTVAISQLTTKDRSVNAAMTVMSVEYPDPRTSNSSDFSWTEQERNILSLIHLRGLLMRDVARVLAQVASPQSESQNDAKVIARFHQTIDQFMDRGREMRNLDVGNGVTGILAFIPKDNPYQSFEISASSLFRQLRQRLEDRGELDSELKFVLDETVAIQDALEGMVFRMGSKHFAETTKSAERYQAFVASQAKEESERLLAEQRSIAQEQQRQQKAEQAQREAEGKRQREREQRLANNQNGQSNTPFGDRPWPRGRSSPRVGPGGRGSGETMGGGPISNTPTDFGSAFPPPHRGPPRTPAPDVDPAKRVTINATLEASHDSMDCIRDAPQWLKKYPLHATSNGKRLTITIENFDRPLEDLSDGFPMLVFESIDTEKRTIQARQPKEPS